MEKLTATKMLADLVFALGNSAPSFRVYLRHPKSNHLMLFSYPGIAREKGLELNHSEPVRQQQLKTIMHQWQDS